MGRGRVLGDRVQTPPTPSAWCPSGSRAEPQLWTFLRAQKMALLFVLMAMIVVLDIFTRVQYVEYPRNAIIARVWTLDPHKINACVEHLTY